MVIDSLRLLQKGIQCGADNKYPIISSYFISVPVLYHFKSTFLSCRNKHKAVWWIHQVRAGADSEKRCDKQSTDHSSVSFLCPDEIPPEARSFFFKPRGHFMRTRRQKNRIIVYRNRKQGLNVLKMITQLILLHIL